jgi:probable phosphoglycerate mutase
MTTTMYFVRHASHDRLDKVLCGRMPGVELNQAGRGQARRLAGRLQAERIAAVFSSPLCRALQTATPIARALGLDVHVEDALNEIDLGAWSGRAFHQLADDPDWRGWNDDREHARPPGGESMQQVQGRLRSWIDTTCERYCDAGVVAVTHGDVIKAVLADSLDMSVSRHDRIEISPASVSVLLAGRWGRKIHSINEAFG